jgi:hypothetical protein
MADREGIRYHGYATIQLASLCGNGWPTSCFSKSNLGLGWERQPFRFVDCDSNQAQTGELLMTDWKAVDMHRSFPPIWTKPHSAP